MCGTLTTSQSTRINKLTQSKSVCARVCAFEFEKQISLRMRKSRPWNSPELMRTTHNVAPSTTIPNKRTTKQKNWLQLASRRAEAPNRDALEYFAFATFSTQSFHCRMCAVVAHSAHIDWGHIARKSHKSLNEKKCTLGCVFALYRRTLSAHHNNHHYHITLILGCWNFSQNCSLY